MLNIYQVAELARNKKFHTIIGFHLDPGTMTVDEYIEFREKEIPKRVELFILGIKEYKSSSKNVGN